MATIKQYVNLEPDSSDPRAGRGVMIETSINVKKARKVHLFLEPDSGNYPVKKLSGSGRGGIGGPGQTKSLKFTADDGKLRFELLMGTYGGDKFSVGVSRDKQGKKKVPLADDYEVWRKLFYQLTRMKASYSFPFELIETEYKDHFVELEKTSTESCPHKENLETKELSGYSSYFKKKKTPFEAHVILIDRQCDSRTFSSGIGRVSSMKTHIADAQDDWPFADWIVKARSRAAGGPWGSSVSLTRSVSGGRNGVLVDVSAMGVNPATTAVEVDLEWKTLQGSYTGDATYKPNVFIAVGVPRSKQSKSKTVAHEIGHGIGMVPTVGHALQYDNANGGMGSHCRHGAKQSDKSKAQGGTFTGTYTDGTCVMYAFSSEHYKFCPTCVEHVRSAQMFKRDMKARGWG